MLFAEDAVRSAAARELARWKTEEVFQVLLDAAARRATGGLLLALGEFQRPESVPLLFEVLEDDLCRAEAMKSLRTMPGDTLHFSILAVRGQAAVSLDGPSARCRQRATLQLLSELDVRPDDWPDLARFLWVNDAATVVAAAEIGFRVAPESEQGEIATALLRIADKPGFVQEEEACRLLDTHPEIARRIAAQIAREKIDAGEKPNWLSPAWRMLNRLLDR
ncbi:MAG: HEAT repeat domain-containing protein, partial [Terracidiphilus sp.]